MRLAVFFYTGTKSKYHRLWRSHTLFRRLWRSHTLFNTHLLSSSSPFFFFSLILLFYNFKNIKKKKPFLIFSANRPYKCKPRAKLAHGLWLAAPLIQKSKNGQDAQIHIFKNQDRVKYHIIWLQF